MNNEMVEQIFVDDIIPNTFQPRLTFDEKDLRYLADSIKNYGIIQPLILRKVGNKYEIIAGERRYKASKIAGLKTVPAIVRNLNDDESAEIALIENLQRKNLKSIELAQSYKYLLNRGYITEEKLAENLGISKSIIENKLLLLNLSENVQNALLNNQISERHARSLLRLENQAEQKNMLNRVISERLTVKQLDNEIDKIMNINKDNKLNEKEGWNEMDNNINDFTINNAEPNQNEEINSNNEKPKTNIFGFQVPSSDDLEKEAPNLNTETKEDAPMEQIGFNPFAFTVNDTKQNESNDNTENLSDSNETNNMENFELFDIFGDSVTPDNNVTNEEGEVVKPSNLGDEINRIRDLINAIKSDGFNAEMEEYDLEDVYQINIKIQKQPME